MLRKNSVRNPEGGVEVPSSAHTVSITTDEGSLAQCTVTIFTFSICLLGSDGSTRRTRPSLVTFTSRSFFHPYTHKHTQHMEYGIDTPARDQFIQAIHTITKV